MAATPQLREDQHRDRLARHCKIGDALGEAGDEWATVAWFYGAYHLIKAAMLVDPIWQDLKSLKAIHQDLVPDDRFIGRHKGRRRVGGPKEWGVNDLVLMLYRPAAGHYDRLHLASVDVRYSTGLPTGALNPVRASLDALLAMDTAGALQAPINWPKGNP